jgi:hypothetical protein
MGTPSSTKCVGETSYSPFELLRICMFVNDVCQLVGKNMITAFRDYHRVFWNCQTFTKCFLEKPVSSDTLTFGKASDLICTPFSLLLPFPFGLPSSFILLSNYNIRYVIYITNYSFCVLFSSLVL